MYKVSDSGWKTNLAAVLIAVVGVLAAFKLIDNIQAEALLTVFGAFGLYGIRDALKKLNK